MSTLGNLLAEHTMLPGNAVDHLHAVVGEWQLLADLSFADYLMWVRRDDGVLVCVAQCRPNTAPTVLQTDAVGSVVAANPHQVIGERQVGQQLPLPHHRVQMVHRVARQHGVFGKQITESGHR
jgi:hypothetical protein